MLASPDRKPYANILDANKSLYKQYEERCESYNTFQQQNDYPH